MKGKNMELVNLNGIMVQFIKDNSRRGLFMVKEILNVPEKRYSYHG